MSNYYYTSGLTYPQYLQAKSFVSDVVRGQEKAAKAVSLSVGRQARQIIASNEALARENIQCLRSGFDQVKAATEQGFEELSWELGDISRGITDLNATFQWGVREIVAQLAHLNSGVSELVRLAQTPAQTRALEHYQIARDAFRRGLYAEAIEELEKAIQEHKLEWRFHSLMGTIYLADYPGCSEVVDLPRAQQAFLVASRYAEADNPVEAAGCLVGAGRAAYCQRNLGDALQFGTSATPRT